MKTKRIILRSTRQDNAYGHPEYARRETEVSVEKLENGGLLFGYTNIVDGYPETDVAFSLSAPEKITLLQFLNQPEPREWMLEVVRGTTTMVPSGSHFSGELVKVREVMRDEVN